MHDALPLTREERRIAGGQRRRRWFIACFFVAGILGWLAAAGFYAFCQLPEATFAAPDAGSYSAGDVIFHFAGFGSVALLVAVFNLFDVERSPYESDPDSTW